MAELMPMIHAERAALADYLDTLAPEQWAARTWCDRWNVQQVVGHLVASGSLTFGHFLATFIGSGFNFDRFVDKDLRNYAEGTPEQVNDRFHAIIASTRKPPGPAYVLLGEVMVHGEDIRRALGGKGEHPAEHVVKLAEMYKHTGSALKAKKRIAGLRLTATDVDWSTGDGPEVTGPGMSLIMAMVGRQGALVDCTGPGVETLRSRA